MPFPFPHLLAPTTGINEATPAVLRERFVAVFRAMLLAALVSYASYFVLFLVLGVPLLPWVNAAAVVLTSLAWPLVARGHLNTATFVMAVVVLGHTVPASLTLGWSTNFHVFAFLFLVFALLSPEIKVWTKVVLFASITAGYLVLEANMPADVTTMAPRTIEIFKVLNIVMFGATLSYLALIYSSAIWTATASLHAMNVELDRRATTDALTGILNRRSMNGGLDRELARFERTTRPFAIILADVDDFKAVNDHYGHNAGDAALVAIAGAMRAGVREVDQVGRWGGEEFMVLLPETDATAAAAVASRIRDKLQALDVKADGKSIPVRMTFGVATCTPERKSADALIAAADGALYEGKRNGKDRVVVASS